ncbi:hypothetical protein Y032_0178g678 [Ancylostoma ceylanicum]|uniref:Uncharacterized protein n=2 Tax=Ancylostoma ceylanicum TaxID=53326 RepID=A0A016ST16_9BILA|nr:hypothetical protein Y032_0178g678 [Ancylostoma ceylanicum]
MRGASRMTKLINADHFILYPLSVPDLGECPSSGTTKCDKACCTAVKLEACRICGASQVRCLLESERINQVSASSHPPRLLWYQFTDPGGVDGLVGHGRDRTIDRVRTQGVSYHCATRAQIFVTGRNIHEFA